MFIQFRKKRRFVTRVSVILSVLAFLAVCALGHSVYLQKSTNIKNAKMEEAAGENIKLKAEYYEALNLHQQKETLEKAEAATALADGYDYVTASVVHADFSSYNKTVYVNKGSMDGITEGMNVLCDGALAGIVTKTYSHVSRVDTLLNQEIMAGAVHMPGGRHVLVSASKDSLCGRWLQYYTDIHYHDMLFTSYASDRFLPGLYIGYVQSVHKDTENFTLYADISPGADFTAMMYVLIITDLKDVPES